MASNLRDWELLQKKIFTRWANQKLGARQMPLMDDVLADLGQGANLTNLMKNPGTRTAA